MKAPTLPPDESERLKALRDMNLLDTPPDERFDRITRVAQRIFRVPISLVSLVDANRQWFKSRQGIQAAQTDRAISFCGHAILDGTVFHIPDALQDDRFHDNPLVTQEPHIRMYAGYPLRTPEGRVLGSFCIMDRQPRWLNEDELANLIDLGIWVEHEMNALRLEDKVLELHAQREELRDYQGRVMQANRVLKKLASLDALTGVPNRLFFDERLGQEFTKAKRATEEVALLLVDIDRFKQYNDAYGHQAGDECLKRVARIIQATLRKPDDFVARYGGEEFVVLLPATSLANAIAVAGRIQGRFFTDPIPHKGSPANGHLTVSMGLVSLRPGEKLTQAEFVERSDKALYYSKEAGRNLVTAWPPPTHGGMF